MKNIITIIVRLTLSCLVAGFIMGSFYILTSKAKKHNEHVNEEKVMYSLLGYKNMANAPKTLNLYAVYRYIVSGPEGKFIGYLVPTGQGKDTGHLFITLDLTGKLVNKRPISISAEDVMDTTSRDKAIQAALGADKTIEYADDSIMVTEKGRRKAYLVTGKFPGFKSFVTVMLALKPNYTICGLAILEQEEDPGLGAEISQDYFKNQFIDKPFNTLKTLDVVKQPIPDKYLKALENRLQADQTRKIREQYKKHDIFALTGATITSRAVTEGVKGIVEKFAYRLTILDKVIAEASIDVPFVAHEGAAKVASAQATTAPQ